MSSYTGRTRSDRGHRKLRERRGLTFEALEARYVLSVNFTGLYTQSFNSLPTSGSSISWTNDSTLQGWHLLRQPAPATAITAINAGDGSSNAGSFYSFGAAGAGPMADRALGAVASGAAYFGSPASDATAGWMALSLTNTTGTTVNSLEINYDGEQWRNGGNTSAQTMVLEIGFGNTYADVAVWSPIGASFDFTSPIHAATAATLDGNNAASRVAGIGGTVTNLEWNNGATLWLRWTERNDIGNDHGLALDNVKIAVHSWSSQHGDIWNTGRADYTVPVERLNNTFFDYFAWQTRVPGSPSDGTISSSSMAFFDTAGPNNADIVVGGYHWPKGVQGMNRHTGEVLWFGNPDGGETIGVNTPAFSNNGSVVYVTNDASSHPLMAFSTETGPNTYWHNGTDPQPDLMGNFSPKVAPDGRIFVNRWADRPYAATDYGDHLNTTWAADSDLHTGLAEFALYEDPSGLRVVSGGRSGVIKSFDGATESELWSVATGHFTDADTTIDPANGNIYLPMGYGDIVVAGLSKNGSPLWESTVQLVFDWVDGGNNRQRAQTGGALSHDGATFYFQTESDQGDGRLYAINTLDGSVKWSFETHSQGGELSGASSPLVTKNGVIIIGNNFGDTYYAIRDGGAQGELLDSFVVDAAGTARAPATMSADGLLYLPLRTMQSVGGGAQAPTFQVENLFTAFDLSASPEVILPVPGAQKAIAQNHAVKISWNALPNPSGHFDHYAIYRSTNAFTNVSAMSPLTTLNNVNLTSFTDATAENGTHYYYAVTTVSSSGNEVQTVDAIGPRTPRDETDLQVVSIARTPEFARYNVQYQGHEVTEPGGFGPYFFTSASGLGGGQTLADPRFPNNGQMVTYTATVRNRGTNLYGGNLNATWTLDGNVVSTPVQVVSLDPGETVSFQYMLAWDFNPHDLAFEIQVADSRAANNSLTSDPLAAPFLTYIDESFVEEFREVYTTNPATQNDDIIDWLNEHMREFNKIFDEAGTQKRVHYGVLEVVPDDTPDPAGDYSPYGIFPLRYHDDDGNPRLSGYYHTDVDIDYGLLHEMGHQLGLIDVYQLDVSPEMNKVSGQGYQAVDDLMRTVAPFMTDATALAMEHWLRDGHGYFGQYMYSLPSTMQLRILGHDGQPLEGATVKVYQLAERPGVGKLISNQIKFQGTTGANGIYTLPNVPINPALVPPIGTGDVLHDNPFGYVAVVGTNGVFHLRIEYDGFVDYAWLDISEANVAYWKGNTSLAVFDRQLSLGGPVQSVPPSDMTELNADDWEAWAQNASGSVSDDTTRKLVGASSLKFVTDGGFDTYVRYPGNTNARWNITESDFLNISFYAENPSPIGFQSGSPWIRLYDAEGNYVQYQYYQGGGIRDILNDARGNWRSYQIALDAGDNVQDGWRRTTFGTPDLTAISALEIHTDTWGNGFTLWVDGVSLAPSPLLPGDYNRDLHVDAADFVLWRKTVGQNSAAFGGADGDGDMIIGQGDYNVWRAHFGESAAAGTTAAGEVSDNDLSPAGERLAEPKVAVEPTTSTRLILDGSFQATVAIPSLPATQKIRELSYGSLGTAALDRPRRFASMREVNRTIADGTAARRTALLAYQSAASHSTPFNPCTETGVEWAVLVDSCFDADDTTLVDQGTIKRSHLSRRLVVRP